MQDDVITRQVSERYARAVRTGEQICCPTGYDVEDLRSFIPEEVLKASYGCGTPAGLKTVREGETVLDIGSGGGIDCFEASRRVGPTGHVIGLDMTDEMLELARRNAPLVAGNLGYPHPNVEFRKGLADAMPIESGSVDLVISNCVINLSPDKRKVFREMFRVIRPGGRFTLSDIVSDTVVPNYLVHDTDRWGDCLSGALSMQAYLAGLAEAGFRGIHQLAFTPWQRIDGIQFLSLTITGYKLPSAAESGGERFATLRGPFSRVVDEAGRAYVRGVPQRVDAATAAVLASPACDALFLVGDAAIPLLPTDPRLTAIFPSAEACVWQGDYALLGGPFLEAQDDDQHTYQRGVPLEICSKTMRVLEAPLYRPYFVLVNRAGRPVHGEAVSCAPDGGCC